MASWRRFLTVAQRIEAREGLDLRGIAKHPLNGSCFGHGCYRESLIESYLQGLDAGLAFWTQGDAIRRPSAPIPVTVFDIGRVFRQSVPITFRSELGLTIGLPCRVAKFHKAAEEQFAWAAAVHELTHFLCFQHCEDNQPPKDWRWWSEATAIWTEHRVLSAKFGRDHALEHLEYTLGWINRPELSIDHPAQIYMGFPIVEYLAKRFGGERPQNWVGAVWQLAKSSASAWAAINSKIPESVRTTWFSDYCLNAYLYGSPKSLIALPKVYEFCGERQIEASVVVEPEVTRCFSATVQPLSCRYFRIDLPESLAELAVTATAQDLSVEIVRLDSKGWYEVRWPVENGKQVCEPAPEARRFLVVVSNCLEHARPVQLELVGRASRVRTASHKSGG